MSTDTKQTNLVFPIHGKARVVLSRSEIYHEPDLLVVQVKSDSENWEEITSYEVVEDATREGKQVASMFLEVARLYDREKDNES